MDLYLSGTVCVQSSDRTIRKIIDAEITSYAVDEEQEQIYYFAYADGLYVYDIKQSRPGNSIMQEKKWVLQKCLMTENICICIMANGYPMQNRMKNRNYA